MCPWLLLLLAINEVTASVTSIFNFLALAPASSITKAPALSASCLMCKGTSGEPSFIPTKRSWVRIIFCVKEPASLVISNIRSEGILFEADAHLALTLTPFL